MEYPAALLQPQAHLAQPLHFVQQRDHLAGPHAPAPRLLGGARVFLGGGLGGRGLRRGGGRLALALAGLLLLLLFLLRRGGRLPLLRASLAVVRRRLARLDGLHGVPHRFEQLVARLQVRQVGLGRGGAQMRHPGVQRLQQRVGERAGQRGGLAPQRQHRVLHAVRQLRQLGEPERRGAALQGVQPPREIVESQPLVRLLQLDEVIRDALDDLLALVDEPRQELLHHRIKHRASPMRAGPSTGAGRAG